jgi:hypothetical protein
MFIHCRRHRFRHNSKNWEREEKGSNPLLRNGRFKCLVTAMRPLPDGSSMVNTWPTKAGPPPPFIELRPSILTPGDTLLDWGGCAVDKFDTGSIKGTMTEGRQTGTGACTGAEACSGLGLHGRSLTSVEVREERRLRWGRGADFSEVGEEGTVARGEELGESMGCHFAWCLVDRTSSFLVSSGSPLFVLCNLIS